MRISWFRYGRLRQASVTAVLLKQFGCFILAGLSATGAIADVLKDCGQHKDVTAALKACTTLIERGEQLGNAYNNRAVAFFAKGDYVRSLSDANKAVAAKPKFAVAYYNRGNAHISLGEYEHAVADFSRALDLNSKFAGALSGRGLAHFFIGRNDRAIEDLTRAIELSPGLATAYVFRGHAYNASGDYAHAISDYSVAIRRDPKNYWYIRMLAQARFNARDFKGASADLARSLKLKDDIYASIFLYLARVRAGESTEVALTNIKDSARDVWPYQVVELYLEKRSVADTASAATTSDHQCEAKFFIGQWHLLKQNLDQAKQDFLVASESCPKHHVEYAAAKAELKP